MDANTLSEPRVRRGGCREESPGGSSLRPPGRPRVWALALCGLLSACGGGAYYDEGGAYDHHHHQTVDDPPRVSLRAHSDVVAPGSTVRLVAAASDDYAVDTVAFYIRDARGDILLARLGSPPWEITTTVPLNAQRWVTYVARAVDDVGQASRPAAIDIPLRD